MLNGLRWARARTWAILVVGAVLAGCYPTSEHPILVDGQNRSDPNLLGIWYGAFDEDDDRFYLHIVAADSDRSEAFAGGIDILMIQHPDEDDTESGWGIAYAVAAEVAGQHLLSVDYRIDNGEPVEDDMRGLHLFHYDPSTTDQFKLRSVSNEALEELITAGTLSGTVEPGMFGGSRLTSSSADIVRFLETADVDALFGEDFGLFVRQSEP